MSNRNLWDSVRAAAEAAGVAAKKAAQKTKLRAEIKLVDWKIASRKHKFGVEMYNHCRPWIDTQDFYAADDTMISTIRPPLLVAQKEIASREGKKSEFGLVLKQKEAKRAGAFPIPATNIGERAVNVGKSTAMRGSEAKTKTDMAVTERIILDAKHKFGVELFDTFVDLEDTQRWLAPDRDVRAIYDQARRDVEDIIKRNDEKKRRLKELGSSQEEVTSSLPIHGSQESPSGVPPAVVYRDAREEMNNILAVTGPSLPSASAPPASAPPTPQEDRVIQSGDTQPVASIVRPIGTTTAMTHNPPALVPPTKNAGDLLMWVYDD